MVMSSVPACLIETYTVYFLVKNMPWGEGVKECPPLLHFYFSMLRILVWKVNAFFDNVADIYTSISCAVNFCGPIFGLLSRKIGYLATVVFQLAALIDIGPAI